MLTLRNARILATMAHRGQVDKIGVPYIEHVLAVSRALAPFGPDLETAGLFHDIIEDTDWTAVRLRSAGASDRVVGIVEAVTRRPGVPYEDEIQRIVASGRDAVLTKIADNAHNSRPDRAAQLPQAKREKFALRYRQARKVLWRAADPQDVETIITVINPDILHELRDFTD